MIPVIDSVLFTIPVKIREELHIIPGYTEIAYDLIDIGAEQKSYLITIDPAKPLFGKKPVTYKVSSKGQIRVPSDISQLLGIQHKDELDVELRSDKLLLIRGRFYQLLDLINEKRPSFLTSQNEDVLTVFFHEYPDQGGPNLRVKKETFSKFKSLFHRIKAKYEPNNPNSWVGVSSEPEGNFEEAGLSLTLDINTTPETLTIQKLGPGILPEPVSSLWRERNAFTIIEDTIFYCENGAQASQKINFSGREVSAKLHRNGRLFRDYRTAGGYPVGTIELYNGDMVVFESGGTFKLHYWPKIK